MSQFLTHSAAFMNDLAATPVWNSLGWTMWHYLWIGLIELACGILLLTMIPRFYSALRYRFLLVLFALLLVTPIFIFQSLWNDAARINHSLTSEASIPPIWTTAPVMVHAPSQEFIEPDRMPNALQSPWKPDPDAEIPDRSLPQVAVTYPQSPPQTAPKSNGFGPLFFERLAKYVPWLPLIWMIGSPLTLLFLGLGLIGAERYRRQARVILSGDIVDRCAKLASRIGVRQTVLVAFSERVISPVLIGILKPLILLPITAETGWTPAQLEIVLLHELAHVRRWDNLVNLIQRLAEGILFFQPAVWIVSRWLTLEREHCCDELVVRVTGRAQDYATALAELALAEHLPPGVVSSMARHPLLGRIRRILGHEQPLQVSRATLTFALIFSLGCCALASLTQGVEETEPPKKEVERVIEDVGLPAKETVPVEVMSDEVSLEEEPEGSSTLPPSISINSEFVPEIDDELSRKSNSLPAKINRAIKAAGLRQLTAGQHTPWQVVQLIHGLKREAELITPEGKKINALEWLATARTFQGEALWEKTEWGGRAHPFTKHFLFEGPPTQFLAILSSCDLPLDYEFQTADGPPITVQDILNDAKMRVEEATDLTWTLWALVHYLPVDASWKNAKGEDWSIERLVKHLVYEQTDSFPNAYRGASVLYVLAHTRNQYLKTGKPLEGIWLKADEKIKARIEYARNLKQGGFRFSDGFMDSKTHDFGSRLSSSGYIFDWLVMALSPEELSEEWIRSEIESLTDDLYANCRAHADVGPFFHAIDALNLYRHKTSPDPKPLAYPLTGGKPRETHDAVQEQPAHTETDANNRKSSKIDPKIITGKNGKWVRDDSKEIPSREVRFKVSGDRAEIKPQQSVHVKLSPLDDEDENRDPIALPNDGAFQVDSEGILRIPVPERRCLLSTSMGKSLVGPLICLGSQLPDPVPLVMKSRIPLQFRAVDPSIDSASAMSVQLLHVHNTIIHDKFPFSMHIQADLELKLNQSVTAPYREDGLTGNTLNPYESLIVQYPNRTPNEEHSFTALGGIFLPQDPSPSDQGKPGHPRLLKSDDKDLPIIGKSWIEVVEATDNEIEKAVVLRFPECICEVTGTVKDERGTPLPNVQIQVNRRYPARQHPQEERLAPERPAWEIPVPVWDKIPTSDPEGKFHLQNHQPGDVAIYAILENGHVSEPFYGRLSTEKPTEVNFVVNSSARAESKANASKTSRTIPKTVTRKNDIFVRDNSKEVATRNITFHITTPLGRPLPGIVAEVYTQPELGKSAQQIPADGASDHLGRLTLPLPAEGIFDCSFMENDSNRQGVTGNQSQIPKSVGRVHVKPGEWKEAEEIPVIIGRPGRLVVEFVLPEKFRPPASSAQSFPLVAIQRVRIPGYGTTPSLIGNEMALNLTFTPGRLRAEGRMSGQGEVLMVYPRGISSLMNYPMIGSNTPRHMQPEPPMFSTRQSDPTSELSGTSWIEVIPFDHEADESRTIDVHQCVCQIRGSVKNEKGEPLPKVEIRVNRHLPPVMKDGPLSREREIAIPVWDNIPRSNETGEFTLERMQPGQVAIYAIQRDGKTSETVYAELNPDKPVEVNLVVKSSDSSTAGLPD